MQSSPQILHRVSSSPAASSPCIVSLMQSMPRRSSSQCACCTPRCSLGSKRSASLGDVQVGKSPHCPNMDACMPIPVWPPFRPGITGERTRHLAMGRSDQRRREARRIAQSVETIARLIDIFDGRAHTTRTAPVDEKLRVLRGEEMSRAAAPSSSASRNQSTPDACFTFDCSNPSPEIRYPTVFAQKRVE